MADKKKTHLVTDLRALDDAQLTARLAEARKMLAEHKRSLAAQELPSPAVLAKTRKEIATTLTVMGEKRRQPAAKKEEK